ARAVRHVRAGRAQRDDGGVRAGAVGWAKSRADTLDAWANCARFCPRGWSGLAPVWWTVLDLASGYIKVKLHLLFRGILLFGPRRSHSSVPTRMTMRPARGAAVKDGPLLGPPEGLVLDGREHAGRLARVGRGCEPTFVLDGGEIADRGVAAAR